MKPHELRTKDQDQLKQTLLDLLKEQFNLRMQQGAKQLTKPSRMKIVRREIARIKTIMHEKATGNLSNSLPNAVSNGGVS
jgi:large subunit ribosomal protein L29